MYWERVLLLLLFLLLLLLLLLLIGILVGGRGGPGYVQLNHESFNVYVLYGSVITI